jgi:pimeloyl-ACP methyl ester carboxylesterase
VFFLHGYGGDASAYAKTAALLDGKGWITWRANISSTGPEDSVARSFVAAREQFDTFFVESGLRLDEICIIGLSLGGCLAALLSAQRPVGSLVLQMPALYKDDQLERPLREVISVESEHARLIEWRALPCAWQESRVLRALHGYTGCTLVVGGEEDKLVPRQTIRNFAAACAVAEVKMVSMGHGPKDEAEQLELAALAYSWLQ